MVFIIEFVIQGSIKMKVMMMRNKKKLPTKLFKFPFEKTFVVVYGSRHKSFHSLIAVRTFQCFTILVNRILA